MTPAARHRAGARPLPHTAVPLPRLAALPAVLLAVLPAVLLAACSASAPAPAAGASRPAPDVPPGLAGPVAGSVPRGPPLGIVPAKPYWFDPDAQPASAGAALFQGALRFYRTVISSVDGDRAHLAPVTSVYAHRALNEHGAVLGIVLTAERLLREPDEYAHLPAITEDGRTFYLDPLEHNTYWLPHWLR